MFGIIALVFVAVVALVVLSVVVHALFSPWLLLIAAAVVLWLRFGPRRSRR
jgi:hypothetical protein